MRYLTLSCLLITGCNDKNFAMTERNNDYGPSFQEVDGNVKYSACRMMTVTNGGHRFFIIQCSSHDAISCCEVTDASLIKTNAENP